MQDLGFFFFEVWLIYNVFVSIVQQTDSVIHIYIHYFSDFFFPTLFAGSQFPNQGLNLGHSSKSTRS